MPCVPNNDFSVMTGHILEITKNKAECKHCLCDSDAHEDRTSNPYTLRRIRYQWATALLKYIMADKRNATIEFCQISHVVHKHQLHVLTTARTLSKASGLFKFIGFCLSGMWMMNISTAVRLSKLS